MPAAAWRHAIEIHPAGWHCPAAPFWIAGWIAAPDGRAVLDVRAWLGGRPQLGLAGLPRPDLGMPHAGFSFFLHPHAGVRQLRLEACDATGRWQEFHRQSLDVAPGAPAAELPVADIAPALLRLLAAHRAHPGFPWAALATDALAAEHARPLNCLPNPPYFGALERPGATANVRYGRFVFTGWLAHREQSIVRLTAFVDPAKPALLVHGLPHADVTAEFAGLRDATASRFVGYCEAPDGVPPPACLRIFAELDDGRAELVFAWRIRPVITTGTDAGLPPLSRYTFWRATRALRAAARRLGWPWGDPAQVRAAERSAWAEFAALAPPPPVRPLPPPRISPPAAARPLTVTLVTHNLNREGAPLIALEYARHLAARPGWRVHVVSPQDGPLRADFLAAGLPVELLDVQPLLAAPGPVEFASAVAALPLGPAWAGSDLIVANTMVTFWAVHLAHRLRKPSILYVHESASVRNFFAPYFIPGLIPCIEAAFGLATRTVFSADAARAAHAGLERRGNSLVLPGWIDTAHLGAAPGGSSSAELRRTHGVPADAVVFANIGSVSDRKGQLELVRAIERLLRDRSDRGRATPPLVFLIVGAAPSEYGNFLRDYVDRRQLTAVRIIGQTADARPYFRAADIFVCASFEEALPRVVMEAAVFGLPIVSTAVNGIPEILGPQDAWLVPPGDSAALAAALEAALEARLQGDRTRAERAQRKVREQFAAAVLLPQHLALAAAVAAEPAD
jgi:glycosyltransferase involved in cell wall biosynthesis